MRFEWKGEPVQVQVETEIDRISLPNDFPFPLNQDFLRTCKKGNPSPQRYYYLKTSHSFAFFVMFTVFNPRIKIGKRNLGLPIYFVGSPSLVAERGYITNDEEMLFAFIRRLPGVKYVTNNLSDSPREGYYTLEIEPEVYFDNRFSSMEEYLGCMRKGYRKRVLKALNVCKDMQVEESSAPLDEESYQLYLATSGKSVNDVGQMERCFFDDLHKVLVTDGGKRVGFVAMREDGDRVFGVFCGMLYNEKTPDVYILIQYKVLERCIVHGFRRAEMGQTSEETKLKLGAQMEKRYLYMHHPISFMAKIFYKLTCEQYRKKNWDLHFNVFKTDDQGNVLTTASPSEE